MKIMMVHNEYGAYSGEEAYIDKVSALFSVQGHQVARYSQSTAAARQTARGTVNVFLSGIYARGAASRMQRALAGFQPDVVNVHNLYPFISPASLFVCKDAGIPVVMTVHNYRLICPTGLLLRRGRPCEQCLARGHEWGCVQHNCEHNMAKSVGYALRNYIARRSGAYIKNVDAFVCLSWFQRNILIQAGFDPDRLFVIPNFLPASNAAFFPTGQYVGFAGRLSIEKGWDMLLEIAGRHPDIPFHVAAMQPAAGSGGLPPNVHLRGFLTGESLRQFYANARLLVVPSRAYEGFPNVGLEAMAMGKPLIAPDHGAFPELLMQDLPAGRLFMAGHTAGLEEKILELWEDDLLATQLGKNAINSFHAQFTDTIAYDKWQRLLKELTSLHP